MSKPFSFIVDKKRFSKRISSDLQHKLRVAMKCYTIIEFKLLENNSYTFKKRHRHSPSKLKFTDSKTYIGQFAVEELENDQVQITLFDIISMELPNEQ